MRSVRRTILGVVLLIVATPFLMLAVALLYERVLISSERTRLEGFAATLDTANVDGWHALAAEHGVWLRRFDAQGHVVWDSHTEGLAQSSSPVARGLDQLLRVSNTKSIALQAEGLERAPLEPTSVETDDGRAVVVRVPLRRPDGSSLSVDSVLRRGIRQLVLVRFELAKLVLLQTLVALIAGLVLARTLVRPLESLAGGAREFPIKPLADPELLARRDELGDVARSLNELVTSLDARWRDTVSLAGDLTHEFKNPLAIIAAASERLADAKELTPEKRAQWTKLIGEAVVRLQGSTEALLAEVRAADRARSAKRVEVEYQPWLQRVLDGYAKDPRWAGWHFELQVAANVGRVQLDEEGWAMAVRNLLDNALVQPATEPRVRLEVSRVGTRVITDVLDFGPGVSEGNREKVFQRFFTQRPAGTPRGTGLGLAIVRAVAEAHGGTVTLEPSARGACFRLTSNETQL